MIHGSKLDVVAYFEGVNIPILSISISSTVNMPSIATMDIPYTNGMEDIMVTTHVAVFYCDTDSDNASLPAIDRYKLLFHGEVTATRIQRNAVNMTWQVYAIDSRSYLNRMPSQFAWYLVADNVQEYADDYNFYGLPVDAENNASTSWYENITQLQIIRPQSYTGGGIGSDRFAGSMLKLKSPMGIRTLRGKTSSHIGEDFVPSSDRDANCRLFSPWTGTVTYGEDQGGYGNWVQVNKSPTEWIQFGHLELISPIIKDSGRAGQGQWIGNMGNTGYSTGMHVHIRWYRKGSSASLALGADFADYVRLTQQSATGKGVEWTLEGQDMMQRIIGYGQYRANSYDGTGDISIGERPMSYSGSPEDIKKYPLDQYLEGFLSLLATCSGQHKYYRNANTRFNIKANHDAQDYGDQFKTLWGADYYVSFMGSGYRNLSKYRYTTADNMYATLRSIGYIALSTTSPKYDSKNNRLYEYLLTVDLLCHKPPMFNYINIEEEDSLAYSGKSIPITALRYTAGFNGIKSVIADHYSPDNAWGIGGMQLIDEERVYGINRVSEDMDYFLKAYIAENALEYGSQLFYQRTLDYARITRSTASDAVEVTKLSFHPEYVVGLPTAIYSKDLNVEYDGVIKSIDMYINVNAGNCQTRIVVQNPNNSEDPYYIGSSRVGITYNSHVDNDIISDVDMLYKEHFYPDGMEDSVVASDRKIDVSSIPKKLKTRDMCTMRQYLTMYKHKKIESISGQIDISTINDFSVSSDGIAPKITLTDNATNILTIGKMSDMYIKERYIIAKALADKIKGNRIIVINE